MTTSLEITEKEVQIVHLHPERFHRWKDYENWSADPEIIVLREIIKKEKKEITEGKIYSPVGNLAERAKKTISYANISYVVFHEYPPLIMNQCIFLIFNASTSISNLLLCSISNIDSGLQNTDRELLTETTAN